MEKPAPRPGLIATILILMAAAFVLSHLAPRPDLRESRILAARPRATAGLTEFRRQADAYVADRFPARSYLIGWLNFARLAIGDSGSDRVLVGRDGWLFYNDGSRLGPARGVPTVDDTQSAAWLRGLSARTEALKARGAIYLLVVPPAKETIYPQLGPAWYRGPNPQRISVTLAARANRADPGHVVYLQDQVQAVAASGTEAFSRHDTHWTGDGAYAGYAAIMDRLRGLGVDQPTRPLSDFQPVVNGVNPPRDLALMLGVASFVPIHYRGYVDPAAGGYQTTWLSEKRGWTAPQMVDTGLKGKPTLLLTRDSFSNALTPFLLGHFSRVVMTHIDDGFWRQDLIDRFHPDVVMLEVQEHGLRFAMQGSPVAARSRFAPLAGAALTALNASNPTPGCNVDQALMDAHGLTVSGWISDLSVTASPTEGAARLTGSAGDFVQPLTLDVARADVAAAFKRPVAQPSGFSAKLNLEGVPQGAYDLRVYRRTVSGWIGCPGPKGLLRP